MNVYVLYGDSCQTLLGKGKYTNIFVTRKEKQIQNCKKKNERIYSRSMYIQILEAILCTMQLSKLDKNIEVEEKARLGRSRKYMLSGPVLHVSLGLGFELPQSKERNTVSYNIFIIPPFKKKSQFFCIRRHFLVMRPERSSFFFFMGPKKRKRDGVPADIFKRSQQKIVNFAPLHTHTHTQTQKVFLT